MRSLHAMLLVVVGLQPPRGLAAQTTNTSPSKGTMARQSSASESAGWFGLSLECKGCIETPSGTGVSTQPSIITRVWPGGAADRASLKVGDTIFAVNGKSMAAPQLRAALAATKPGETLRLLMGTSRGRFSYSIRKKADSLETIGNGALPVRYHGEFATVTIDVLTKDTPVVSRDSTGAMLIQVGGHVVRLQQSPPRR